MVDVADVAGVVRGSRLRRKYHVHEEKSCHVIENLVHDGYDCGGVIQGIGALQAMGRGGIRNLWL